MLSLKERQAVLKWFRRFCTVDLFPVQVDIKGWKVQPGCSTRARSWASKASYALYLAHSLYKVLSLVYTLLFLRGVPLHQMIIHGVMASAAVNYGLWYFILYVKYVDENAAVLRMTLTGAITGGIL